MYLSTKVKKNEVFFVLKPTLKNYKNPRTEFIKKFILKYIIQKNKY